MSDVIVTELDQVSIIETDELTTIVQSGEAEISVVTTEESQVVVVEAQAEIIHTQVDEVQVIISETPEVSVIYIGSEQGPVGPQGPAGISEDDMPYAKRVDFVSDSVFYTGKAQVGTSVASALWQISKTTVGEDGDVTVEWADGVSDFTKTWNDRLTYPYV